ncbi:hypothetical protein BD0136_14010 [Helicobacter pylori]
MPLVWGIKPKGNTIKPNADHKKISAVTNSTIMSNNPKNNNSPKTTRKNMMSLGIMVSQLNMVTPLKALSHRLTIIAYALEAKFPMLKISLGLKLALVGIYKPSFRL